MATTYTYPGVYIEEIPSGVHTITGVSTSDTAFIDFFERGPVDKAKRCTSFADFERQFGGLHRLSEASYAIQQYYLNGGTMAWVIRVVTSSAQAATCPLAANPNYYASGATSGPASGNSLTVKASNPGLWGNNLQVGVDYKGITKLAPVTNEPLEFNLAVREVVQVGSLKQVAATEIYRNLSMDNTRPNYVKSVIDDQSSLITIDDVSLGELPQETGSDVIGVIGDTKSAAFLSFGQGGGLPGVDGDVPGATELLGDPVAKTGMYALDNIQPFIFNILCIPAAANLSAGMSSVITDAKTYCHDKRAILIVDIPKAVNTPDAMINWTNAVHDANDRNAAIYFPRLQMPDPLDGFRLRDVGDSGTLAGIYARTDAARGVWKAPAGTDSGLQGATPIVLLDDQKNGDLNQLGINVVRTFPIFGSLSWGARTLDGADQQASEWKYIPVRRTALYIEESLYQGLKWVVFEPNDEPLWSQIRLNVGAFMQDLFRRGAFQGATPRDAYFVKCDKDTTTQNDIDHGIVNILVGFAPLKPVEFVVVKIQQMAGQIQA
jgi:phage tail sheath protein FI